MCDIPVHCVIEALGDGCCINCARGEESIGCRKLLDSYAIVSGRTPLSKLNDAVLTALGYPQFSSLTSLSFASGNCKTKGLVVIDNWKPLTFDQITDDMETPVEYLFKPLGGNRWTLKIIVSSNLAPKNCSPLTIASNTPGASDDIPDSSVKGTDAIAIADSADISRVNWYNFLPRYHPYFTNLISKTEPSTSSIAAFMANRLTVTNAYGLNPDPLAPTSPLTNRSTSAENGHHLQEERRRCGSESEVFSKRSPPKLDLGQQRRSVLVSPPRAIAGNVPSRNTASTCRLMFDPLTELPMLNEWFENNSHPTSNDIERYTDTLNSKAYRRTYPLVSTHNVKIWFKNRRAKCKRI